VDRIESQDENWRRGWQRGMTRRDKVVEGGDSRGSVSEKRRKLMHSLCKIAEARG